jgi:hypothetical protein
MSLFGLYPDQISAQARAAGVNVRIPSLTQSLLIGSSGFTLASLVVFATVAYGERWMYRNLTVYGAYLVWTVLFVLLGGFALRPLLIAGSTARFYLLFGIAFFLYAVGWVAAYFTLRDGFGEWVASFAGSALMAFAFAWAFGAWRSLLKLIIVIFIANSVGYFLGALLNSALRGRVGMVMWGLLFGLGLGAGLGYAIYEAQSEARARLSA